MQDCHGNTGSTSLKPAFINHAFAGFDIEEGAGFCEVDEESPVGRQTPGDSPLLLLHLPGGIFFTAALAAFIAY